MKKKATIFISFAVLRRNRTSNSERRFLTKKVCKCWGGVARVKDDHPQTTFTTRWWLRRSAVNHPITPARQYTTARPTRHHRPRVTAVTRLTDVLRLVQETSHILFIFPVYVFWRHLMTECWEAKHFFILRRGPGESETRKPGLVGHFQFTGNKHFIQTENKLRPPDIPQTQTIAQNGGLKTDKTDR